MTWMAGRPNPGLAGRDSSCPLLAKTPTGSPAGRLGAGGAAAKVSTFTHAPTPESGLGHECRRTLPP